MPLIVASLLSVNDRNHNHEHHNGHAHTPRWRRVHRSWIFLVAVFLMLLAIVAYVMTGDLPGRFIANDRDS